MLIIPDATPIGSTAEAPSITPVRIGGAPREAE
jgi:hypothetical protein